MFFTVLCIMCFYDNKNIIKERTILKEGPKNHVCAWSPLPSQITVHVAKRWTTQTCCRADGQTLLTLQKEEVTVVTASMMAPVNACVRV